MDADTVEKLFGTIGIILNVIGTVIAVSSIILLSQKEVAYKRSMAAIGELDKDVSAQKLTARIGITLIVISVWFQINALWSFVSTLNSLILSIALSVFIFLLLSLIFFCVR